MTVYLGKYRMPVLQISPGLRNRNEGNLRRAVGTVPDYIRRYQVPTRHTADGVVEIPNLVQGARAAPDDRGKPVGLPQTGKDLVS